MKARRPLGVWPFHWFQVYLVGLRSLEHFSFCCELLSNQLAWFSTCLRPEKSEPLPHTQSEAFKDHWFWVRPRYGVGKSALLVAVALLSNLASIPRTIRIAVARLFRLATDWLTLEHPSPNGGVDHWGLTQATLATLQFRLQDRCSTNGSSVLESTWKQWRHRLVGLINFTVLNEGSR